MQLQRFIPQFLTGNHLLSQSVGISYHAESFLVLLQTAQHFGTENLIGRIFLPVLDGTTERRREKQHFLRS